MTVACRRGRSTSRARRRRGRAVHAAGSRGRTGLGRWASLSPPLAQPVQPHNLRQIRRRGANAEAGATCRCGRLVRTYQVLTAGKIAGSVVSATSRVYPRGLYPAGSRSTVHHVSLCPSLYRHQPPSSSTARPRRLARVLGRVRPVGRPPRPTRGCSARTLGTPATHDACV